MLPHPVGNYKFSVDAYLTDFRGKATLPMIGNFLLQAATKHAEERGFGYSRMTNDKKVWVLSRMVIEIFEYPVNDVSITIHTWVADVNRLYTERYFSLENKEGKEIGFAKTLWLAIDLNSRKPMNILEIQGLSNFMYQHKNCPIDTASKIPLLKEEDEIADTFTVKYSDIDINKHLNSIKYIEHLINVFDIQLFKDREIKRIEINYLTECHYGSVLTILKKAEPSHIYYLEIKNKDTSICSSKIIWK